MKKQKNLHILEANISVSTFLFIAKLTAFTRKDAEFYVEAEGGKVLSDVSAALNYLICGKGAKKERDIAEDIGTVTILTEKAFLKIMKSNAEKK